MPPSTMLVDCNNMGTACVPCAPFAHCKNQDPLNPDFACQNEPIWCQPTCWSYLNEDGNCGIVQPDTGGATFMVRILETSDRPPPLGVVLTNRTFGLSITNVQLPLAPTQGYLAIATRDETGILREAMVDTPLEVTGVRHAYLACHRPEWADTPARRWNQMPFLPAPPSLHPPPRARSLRASQPRSSANSTTAVLSLNPGRATSPSSASRSTHRARRRSTIP